MSERNRILIIGSRETGKLTLLKKLSGSLPTIEDDVHASLSHELEIKNKYYSAKVGVWVDEFDSEIEKVQEWVSEFRTEMAKEVRDILGAVIYTINEKSSKEEIEEVGKFIEKLDEEEWEGVALAVSKRGGIDEGVEDLLFDLGFEYINGEGKSVREEGEYVTGGIDRIKEAIEVFPWTEEQKEVEGGEIGGEEGEDEEVEEENGASLDELIKSMSKPILDEGSEESVEDFDKFMAKLQKIREEKKEISHEERLKLSEDLADELLNLI